MCGRFVSSSSPAEIARYFSVDSVADGVETREANFNTAPTNTVMVVYEDGQTRRLDQFKWGLVPSWAKDPKIGSRMINARAETVAEKPSFRSAFARRRCIIPADGFYEWTTDPADPKKQPYYIHDPSGQPYAFAGLWEQWRPREAATGGETASRADSAAGEDVLRTCTIITTAANQQMSELHDRMPVMLGPDQWEPWLSPENHDKQMLGSFLVPASNGIISFHAVSKDVNNARSRGAELLAPI